MIIFSLKSSKNENIQPGPEKQYSWLSVVYVEDNWAFPPESGIK